MKQDGLLFVSLIERTGGVADKYDGVFQTFRTVDRHKRHASASGSVPVVGFFARFTEIPYPEIESVKPLERTGFKALGVSEQAPDVFAGSGVFLGLSQKYGCVCFLQHEPQEGVGRHIPCRLPEFRQMIEEKTAFRGTAAAGQHRGIEILGLGRGTDVCEQIKGKTVER